MTLDVHQLELSLLDTNWEENDEAKEDHLWQLARSIRQCNFEEILFSKEAESILQSHCRNDPIDEDFFAINAPIGSNADIQYESTMLMVGISALQAFVQSVYTGPDLNFDETSLYKAQTKNMLREKCLKALEIDGEAIHELTSHLPLFIIAKRLLNFDYQTLPFSKVWRIRANFLHQRLLNEPISSLHLSIFTDLQNMEDLINSESKAIRTTWLVEKATLYSFYGYDEKSLSCLEEAAKVSGFQYAITGVLGKRTKFQKTEVSQLIVLAKASDLELGSTNVPASIELDDEVLLNKLSLNHQIHVVDTLPADLAVLNPAEPEPLNPTDCIILLGLTFCIKNTNPAEGITREQMAPYTTRVLAHPSNWSIYTMALILRSRLESFGSRTVERSVLQLQALVDQISDERNSAQSVLPSMKASELASPRGRLRYFWQLLLPNVTELELELASRWTSIGAVKTALEIFERLQMWSEVAMCYAASNNEARASEVLREQLKLHPNDAKLWCLLGDVEKDATHWKKAWAVSDKRYARAQRSLGKHHFAQRHFLEAIEAFQLSLQINPLNQPAWFIYGCCGLETQAWDIAAEAFTRCISIDVTDAESWNNLGSALLRAGRKTDALNALKQATSNKFDSWRTWENYSLVAADLGRWNDVAVGLKHVIQIRGPKVGEAAVDEELLELLIGAVVKMDFATFGVQRTVADLALSDVTPLITSNPRLWLTLARLHIWRRRPDEALDAYVKAYRIWMARADLERNEEAWNGAVSATEDLVDAYRSLGDMEGRLEGSKVAPDWRYKSVSVLRSLLSRGRLSWSDSVSYQKIDDLLQDFKG